MKKVIFFLGIVLLSATGAHTQHPRVDSIAVLLLQRMSVTMNDVRSASFTVLTDYDLSSEELGLVKHSGREQVFIRKPDKMMIAMQGDNGRRSYWYNGKNLSYYSFDNNLYAQLAAPPTLLEMMDSVNKRYGVEIPGADFFYPSMVDDLLDTVYNLVYLGITTIDGKPVFHIAGTMPEMTFQVWINNDEFFLPARLVIVYTGKANTPQYQAIYTDWKLNPDLPTSMFEFRPPPGAGKTKLNPKPVAR